jgi:predicted nuclease with TOPRIM domain
MSSDNERKKDLKYRISALNQELTPLLAKVENLRERISHLESDLADVLDEQHIRTQYQKSRSQDVREVR